MEVVVYLKGIPGGLVCFDVRSLSHGTSIDLMSIPNYYIGLWQMMNPPTCSRCSMGMGDKLSVCPRCLSTTYCGQECQHLDWAEHKKVCPSLAVKALDFHISRHWENEDSFIDWMEKCLFCLCWEDDMYFPKNPSMDTLDKLAQLINNNTKMVFRERQQIRQQIRLLHCLMRIRNTQSIQSPEERRIVLWLCFQMATLVDLKAVSSSSNLALCFSFGQLMLKANLHDQPVLPDTLKMTPMAQVCLQAETWGMKPTIMEQRMAFLNLSNSFIHDPQDSKIIQDNMIRMLYRMCAYTEVIKLSEKMEPGILKMIFTSSSFYELSCFKDAERVAMEGIDYINTLTTKNQQYHDEYNQFYIPLVCILASCLALRGEYILAAKYLQIAKTYLLESQLTSSDPTMKEYIFLFSVAVTHVYENAGDVDNALNLDAIIYQKVDDTSIFPDIHRRVAIRFVSNGEMDLADLCMRGVVCMYIEMYNDPFISLPDSRFERIHEAFKFYIVFLEKQNRRDEARKFRGAVKEYRDIKQALKFRQRRKLKNKKRNKKSHKQPIPQEIQVIEEFHAEKEIQDKTPAEEIPVFEDTIIQEDEEDEECSVCFSEMVDDENKMLSCGHSYHSLCLVMWISKCEEKGWEKSCPTCRTLINM